MQSGICIISFCFVFLCFFSMERLCRSFKSHGQTGRNRRQFENESSSGWNAIECAWKRQRQEAESAAEAQGGEETELSSRQWSESLTCQRDIGGAVWSAEDRAAAAAAAAKWIPERKVLGEVSHRYFDADSHFPHDSASRFNRIRDVLWLSSEDVLAARPNIRDRRVSLNEQENCVNTPTGPSWCWIIFAN